jgi:hypothetical protein
MDDVFLLLGITCCSGGCKVIQLHFDVNVVSNEKIKG